MIDIHAHILPGVDDGAVNMDESVEMALMASDSGVDYLVATPHCNIPGVYDNYLDDELRERFMGLKRVVEAEQIPIRILGGMEVFATSDLPDLLKKKKILTLNGTKYFLMEFAFDEDLDFCSMILEQCFSMGYIPVIAHPERYYGVQDHPEIVYQWYIKGYKIQINKGSILGRFGKSVKRTADQLLEHRIVTCIGSDAHSPYRRTPHMAEIREYMRDNYGNEYTRLLTEENPRRILMGEKTAGYRPISFVKNGWEY